MIFYTAEILDTFYFLLEMFVVHIHISGPGFSLDGERKKTKNRKGK